MNPTEVIARELAREGEPWTAHLTVACNVWVALNREGFYLARHEEN
jgi:hypothetical protein